MVHMQEQSKCRNVIYSVFMTWELQIILRKILNEKSFKGPYADHILIPQGATASSTSFGVK